MGTSAEAPQLWRARARVSSRRKRGAIRIAEEAPSFTKTKSAHVPTDGAKLATLPRVSCTPTRASRNPEPEDLQGLPKPGDIFDDKYCIDGVVGVGGMGVVLAATHLRLDERVAIKFLLPQWAADSALVERFMREGRASAKIRSEHVVRVLDVGLVLDQPYLVLEYLVGQDFQALVEERGPMLIPDAVDRLLQACEALAEAHMGGIIHRDLKPANLFLTHRADGSACVKVLDFGLSKVAAHGHRLSGLKTQATLASAVMGSPTYMAPEQMQSATSADERSDILVDRRHPARAHRRKAPLRRRNGHGAVRVRLARPTAPTQARLRQRAAGARGNRPQVLGEGSGQARSRCRRAGAGARPVRFGELARIGRDDLENRRR